MGQDPIEASRASKSSLALVWAKTKVFRIPKKEPGLGGAVKGLFRPRYESKTAVNGINFKLEAGEIVGCIGVN